MIKDIDFGKLTIDVQIGKNKINENLIEHIKKVLKSKEVTKIKMLQNFLNDEDLVGNKDKKKEIIKDLEKQTESKCVFFVGNTFCLYKKKIVQKKTIDEKYKPTQKIFNKFSKIKTEKDNLNPPKRFIKEKPKIRYDNRKNFKMKGPQK
ncbi:MAG: YhbY family RNA-binding protein [Candidatus Nanoarchaeia archaeon]|nr:YhbY family RNA-binding protein [Candidatus Nanoarchaeia archaeon]